MVAGRQITMPAIDQKGVVEVVAMCRLLEIRRAREDE